MASSHDIAKPFSTIVETKITLQGQHKVFTCQRLDGNETNVTVLFISDRPMRVADIDLPTGTVTFGHFWRDRLYNVYHWLTPTGTTLAHYFNIAHETTISADALQWHDLELDVLCRPGASPEVLDEDELPPDLPAPMRQLIDQGIKDVFSALPALQPGLESAADDLWCKVFGQPREGAR
ncbi:MAG: DUF402 domain-containing protein [Deltaproteobacteria bacterium]|nr:DUF402 domain-containing protein [Deltaproteobacteria bacterium]